ncbi:MAG: efflux RND transporter periplasmic adaptor subunit [Terriglobia bacterium]
MRESLRSTHTDSRTSSFDAASRPLSRRLRTLAALGSFAALVLLSTGCNRKAATAVTASGQSSATSADTPSLFTVPQNQMAHLQIVPVKSTDLPQLLTLPGSVAYNSFATTPVITQVSGPVLRVLVYPGQFVKKGQPMLTVTSPDYAVMRDNYIKAHDAFNLAQINEGRAKDLYAHNAISLSALEQAQSAEVQAQADLTASEQALKVVGISNPAQEAHAAASPEIPLLAPVSGEVVERTVSPGQVIAGGSTQCFTISNMNTVWVLANVYQSALQYIHLGDHVEIETDAYPMKFSGRISYIAPAMDPTTRTLQVRIVTNNPGERLKKDMYVTVLVNGAAIRGALTVPAAAVLRNSENQPFVYVAQGPRQFARQLVEIGPTQNGQTQITSGLRVGEQVMGDGSLFVEFANSLR